MSKEMISKMDAVMMRSRLIDLTKREIDLVPLMDLTVYDVDRELKLNQGNFQISFWVKEPFNNEGENSHHYLYRSHEGEAYEILSLLIRLEIRKGTELLEWLEKIRDE